MHDHEPCAVENCPALAVSATGFCAAHEHAKIAFGVGVNATCTACRKPIHNGDWVTRESVLGSRRHVVCPPPKPKRVRKRDQWRPLIDEIAHPIAPKLALLLALALVGAACGAVTPTAPTAPARTVALTVRALVYVSEAPIAGAAVSVDAVVVGATNGAGALALSVTPDVDHTIRVTAPHYVALVPAAEATIHAAGEQWTFYLEPTP